MGREKKTLFAERHVLPPRSWLAIVETQQERESHSNSCSVVQPRNLLFHFTPSDAHKGPSLYLRPGFLFFPFFFFYRFPGPNPFKLFKGMQMDDGSTSKFPPWWTGSLGLLFLHSSVCQRDYCNISGLQYPHLSLWPCHSQDWTFGFLFPSLVACSCVKSERKRLTTSTCWVRVAWINKSESCMIRKSGFRRKSKREVTHSSRSGNQEQIARHCQEPELKWEEEERAAVT